MMAMGFQANEPSNLPFRIVSGTIGQGAYAFIRKASPLRQSHPIIAVKFINKQHAFQHGKLQPKQIKMEIVLHKHLAKHNNIIQYIHDGEDPQWIWIAMELAEGGDLFDKIEADEGVGEDIAHFYFSQLIGAVGYMHDKGVSHRDIKPENVLLSGNGDLKLADFGLATLYKHNNVRKMCVTVCGSPPYIAPEIIQVRDRIASVKEYDPVAADIWSCGVVLFVLLVGNTPWDEASVDTSVEFEEYVRFDGRTPDQLWVNLSPGITSLLRGMLKVDPKNRFSLQEVRRHPWYARSNPHLGPGGKAANPINLATQMLECLRINFDCKPVKNWRNGCGASQVPLSQMKKSRSDGINESIESSAREVLAASQPIATSADTTTPLEWIDRPPQVTGYDGISASQPAEFVNRTRPAVNSDVSRRTVLMPATSSVVEQLSSDPSMSQFSSTPSIALSLTQHARNFRDIVPSYSLARFLSPLSFGLLLPLLREALTRLGVPVSEDAAVDADADAGGIAYMNIKTADGRRQALVGNIVVDRYAEGMLEVRFVRQRGDPVEWRRFFKSVVVSCREAIWIPTG